MFIDKVKIYVKSGNGGNGCVSFRREKYVSHGGPDGGDGGKGGSIIFVIDEGENTLLKFKYRRKFVAENGEDGKAAKFHGKNAPDLLIPVPRGTVIKDAESGRIIKDMSDSDVDEKGGFTLLSGGKGGFGNTHFATPTRQTPNFAKSGIKGRELEVELELKMLADAGLVGMPSAGKSTILSVLSSAKPKIADYHFTTLAPMLGVVSTKCGNFVLADLPGLIEGASEGAGLGHEFLRHIERTKVLLHVVDAASVEGRDPIEDVHAIMDELSAYNPELLKLPQAIAANKLDAVYDEGADPLADLKKEFEPMGIPVFGISAVSGEGVNDLLYYLYDVIRKTDRTPKIFEKEFEIEYVGDRSLPYTVEKDEEGIYVVEGPRIEKMLGYTNLDSEKGFDFFQKFLKQSGILADLEKAGIQEGDTVRMYGLVFDYYK